MLSENLFEHRFTLFAPQEGNSLTLGEVVFYSSSDIVLEEVRYGFLILIFNGIIKTAALWIIFIFCSNRILSKPLQTLTEKTQNLKIDGEEPVKIDLIQESKNIYDL